MLLTDNALPSSPFLKNPDLSVICKTVASKAEIAYTFSNHGTHLSARTLVGYNGPGKVSDDTPWVHSMFVKQIKYYKLILGTKELRKNYRWFKTLLVEFWRNIDSVTFLHTILGKTQIWTDLL